MRWKKLNSTAIRAVAYDRKRKMLYVEFQHGGQYTFPQIGYHRYSMLVRAESAGKYYNMAIRPQKGERTNENKKPIEQRAVANRSA